LAKGDIIDTGILLGFELKLISTALSQVCFKIKLYASPTASSWKCSKQRELA
jgi:hypothetical protein